MSKTLFTEGLIGTKLFKVEGDLVENYNASLEEKIGKKTSLTSFNIDKRGESPEIEAELGRNYLQNGPAHRYLIILSPEQKNAELLHEEFSFDNVVLDKIYENHLPAISAVTRVDGLNAELDDNIITYLSLEDLLLIKSINVELHTPSGFITAAKTLKKNIETLKNNPSLLVDKDSALVKEIYTLAQEVGDVREYAIEKMQTHVNVESFYSRLFNGVYVFKKDGQSKKIKKPSKNIRKKYDELSKLLDSYITDFTENKTLVEPETVVFYNPERKVKIESGPKVQFVPLSDKDAVVDFLISNNYAAFNQNIIDKRLERLEDLHLVELGHNVAESTYDEHYRAIEESAETQTKYWNSWKDAKKLKMALTKGYTFQDALEKTSIDTKISLLETSTENPVLKKMVNHMLSVLVPENYEQSYEYNRTNLEKIYDNVTENHRDYILYVLKNHNNKNDRTD